ncbi:hypothetical protein ACX93W_01630 [Paenibacillus sp. CAU 1782]
MPVKKRMPKEKRMNWRELLTEDWNVLTFQSYFSDMNREKFGAGYVPMRNYSFEQGVIKRQLDEYGPEILRAAFEEAFRTYKPSRDYPILTAGFACAYRINTIIPRLLREKAELERRAAEKAAGPTVDAAELKNVW